MMVLSESDVKRTRLSDSLSAVMVFSPDADGMESWIEDPEIWSEDPESGSEDPLDGGSSVRGMISEPSTTIIPPEDGMSTRCPLTMALLPKAMVVDSVPEVSTTALFAWVIVTRIFPSFHTAVADAKVDDV
jgi:hypothetical protein